MRIARIKTPDGLTFAVIDGEGDEMIAKAFDGHPFATPAFTGKEYRMDEIRLLAPILPTKICAIGRNYADHVKEVFKKSAESLPPTLFIKPSTSVIGVGDPIKIPEFATNVEFEGELAMVISRPCKNVKAENWRDVILGFTAVNDVSSRDLQFADGQWARAKGIDTFCPMGPWIETDPQVDLTNLPIKAHLTRDGKTETKQDSNSNQMIMSFGEIIEFITASMTLLPGDVVSTGSPAGTAPMYPGDFIEVDIPGVGKLGNPIERA